MLFMKLMGFKVIIFEKNLKKKYIQKLYCGKTECFFKSIVTNKNGQ